MANWARAATAPAGAPAGLGREGDGAEPPAAGRGQGWGGGRHVAAAAPGGSARRRVGAGRHQPRGKVLPPLRRRPPRRAPAADVPRRRACGHARAQAHLQRRAAGGRRRPRRLLRRPRLRPLHRRARPGGRRAAPAGRRRRVLHPPAAAVARVPGHFRCLDARPQPGPVAGRRGAARGAPCAARRGARAGAPRRRRCRRGRGSG
jgi:hypothetical protein